MHEHAGASKVIAVAEDAVPIIDLAPVLDMFAELFGVRRLEMQEWVLSGIEIDSLVVDRDHGR